MNQRVNMMPEGQHFPGHSHFAQELRVNIASRAITRRKTVLWRSVVVGGNEGDGEEGEVV